MRRKYDWDDWLQVGYRTEIVRGVDYTCPQSVMAAQVRNAACNRGVRISLVDTGYSIIIEVYGEISNTNKAAVAR